MFHQQVMLLTSILIMADALLFVVCGYTVWYLYMDISWQTFSMTQSVFFLMQLILIPLNLDIA